MRQQAQPHSGYLAVGHEHRTNRENLNSTCINAAGCSVGFLREWLVEDTDTPTKYECGGWGREIGQGGLQGLLRHGVCMTSRRSDCSCQAAREITRHTMHMDTHTHKLPYAEILRVTTSDLRPPVTSKLTDCTLLVLTHSGKAIGCADRNGTEPGFENVHIYEWTPGY